MKRVFPEVLFLLIGILLCQSNVQAQYFTLGADPVSLRWKQIKTDNFTLIFPKESEKQAIEIGSFLSEALIHAGSSLEHQPRKFPLILHSWSSTSNGYTIWAPRRIELFPRPPIIGGAESYADHLLIHEIRHMVQMDKLHTGFTKWAALILGEQATAAVIGLHLSSWFAEGDAILTETLLTNSGRGRQALFFEDLRAIWLEGLDMPYDKARFGSFKDYVPNHYTLGYQMVASSRMLGGWDLWSGALEKMGRRPYTISLMSRYLKKEIGLNTEELYLKSREWAKSYWESTIPAEVNPAEVLPTHDNLDYIHYLKPIQTKAGDYIILKNSLGRIPEFVRYHDSGYEEHLFYPGYIENASFSVSNNLLVWSEYQPDTRWENRSYNNLWIYDLELGRKKKLTDKKRYFSPALNPKGDRLVCLEYLPDGTNKLLILDLESVHVLQSVFAPDQETLQMPVYDSLGNIWVFSTGREGKKLYVLKEDQDQMTLIREFGFKEIFNPVSLGQKLYFIGPYGSSNAIYSYDAETNKLDLVATDRYGINYISAGNGVLTASVYRTNGYKPAMISSSRGTAIQEIPDLDEPYLKLITRAEKETPIVCADTAQSFEIKNYRKFTHLINLHSWAPISFDMTSYQLKPGLMILSQNELGTVQARVGAEFDRTFRRLEYFASINSMGLPIRMDANARTYKDVGDIRLDPGDTLLTKADYRSTQFSLQLSYPMNFSSGRWIRGVTPALIFAMTNYSGLTIEESEQFTQAWIHGGIGINSYIYSRKAYRDLYPRLGFIFKLMTVANTSSLDQQGQTAVTGSVQSMLPGFAQHHSTRLYMGASLKNSWNFPDQQYLLLPRGLYDNFSQYHLSAKIDYAFPFAYPDWNLGSVLYVKRLKANIFYDAAKSLSQEHQLMMTTGIDLTSDFYLFRAGAAFEAGFRATYNITNQEPGIELLVNFTID